MVMNPFDIAEQNLNQNQNPFDIAEQSRNPFDIAEAGLSSENSQLPYGGVTSLSVRGPETTQDQSLLSRVANTLGIPQQPLSDADKAAAIVELVNNQSEIVPINNITQNQLKNKEPNKILKTTKKIGSVVPYIATETIRGLMSPILPALKAVGLDTGKTLDTAIDYWRDKIGGGFAIPNYGIGTDKTGSLEFQRLKDIPATDILGQTAEAFGFVGGPVSVASKAAGLVTAQLASKARPFYQSIARGMITGALVGEGDKEKTLENAALFGIFEPIAYAIGKTSVVPKIIKNSAPWRKMTIKERGLALQSLDEIIMKNPTMTEGEILRKWDNPAWRSEALARRIATKKEPIQAESPFDKIIKNETAAPKVEPESEPLGGALMADKAKIVPEVSTDLAAFESVQTPKIKFKALIDTAKAEGITIPTDKNLSKGALFRHIRFGLIKQRKIAPDIGAGKKNAPYKTEVTAKGGIKLRGLTDIYEPVQVEGGWIGRAKTKIQEEKSAKEQLKKSELDTKEKLSEIAKLSQEEQVKQGKFPNTELTAKKSLPIETKKSAAKSEVASNVVGTAGEMVEGEEKIKSDALNKPISSDRNNIRAWFVEPENWENKQRLTYRGVAEQIAGDKDIELKEEKVPIDTNKPLGETKNAYTAYLDGKKLRSFPKEVYDLVQQLKPQQPTSDVEPTVKEFAEQAQSGSSSEETNFKLYEVEGLKIYKTRIKDKKYFAVQSVENKGTDRIFGDTLHKTEEEAVKQARLEVKLAKEKAERNEKIETKEAEELAKKQIKDADDINGFLKNLSNRQKALSKKVLNKQYRYSDGTIMSIREHVEKLHKNGKLEIRTIEEPKIKPMSRRKYNRANQQEQDAHERKMAKAGNKTTYLVNDSELGKTAYDYAKYLLKQSESKSQKTETKPELTGKEPIIPKKKIGDAQKINNTNSIIANVQRIDGVDYELYNANKLKDKRGFIRIKDVDSGETINILEYPTFSQAETKFNDTIAKASKSIIKKGTSRAPEPTLKAKPDTQALPTKKKAEKLYQGDRVEYKNTGGQVFTGDVKKVYGTGVVDIVPDGVNNPIGVYRKNIVKIIRKNERVRKQEALKAEWDKKTKPSLFQKKQLKEKSILSSGKYTTTPSNVIELPEIVKIAKELMGGKYPKLVKKIRSLGMEAQGAFHPTGEGTIKLVKSLFQDPDQAAKTIAHEVGHLVDYLPEKTMSRGNILGRIASLKKYMKHTIARGPDLPGELTPKDRSRLRREATKLAKSEADKYVDEVVSKTLPIKSDDVLAIWNNVSDKKLLNKNLYDYIASLNTPQKKSIVAAALKGQVADELQRFSKIVTEKTGRQVKQTFSDDEFKKLIQRKYANLINKELQKRKLFSLQTISNELKTLTNVWKPFNPNANPKYTMYRYSSPELYADAVSAIINSPGLVKSVAPEFWSGWFNYMKVKPEVKEIWDNIQDRISRGEDEVSQNRIISDYEMFKRGHDLRNAKHQKENKATTGFKDTLGRGLWDRNFPILKELKKLKKLGGINKRHAEETEWLLEETEYLASEINDLVYDFNKKVHIPANEADISLDDIGIYLMRKHIEMNRADIASTKGYHPKTVIKDLKIFKKMVGDEKYNKIVELVQEYRKIREKRIIPLIEKSGLATPELIKIIKDRTFYSKVSILHYLEDKFGQGTTARFYKQTGTLNEIENPLVATMLQDITVLRAARINITKQALVEELKKLNLIEKAEKKFNPKYGRVVSKEPRKPNISMFTIMVDGKPVDYHVSKAIADTFDRAPYEATQMAKVWQYASQPIREILVNKNPAWMARNPFRDFRDTFKKNPEIKIRHIPKLLAMYKKAWREVWQDAMKGERSGFLSEMYKNKEILSKRAWTAREENFQDEIKRITDSFEISTTENAESITAKKKLTRIWEWLDKIGRVSEIWSKVAGKKYLQKYTNLSSKEIGHRVRTLIGTPNFKAQGAWHQTTNNLFMYSTIGKEGIRSHIEAFNLDPATYIWKTIATNIVPKLILGAAEVAAFGYYWKRVVDRIPEYDKAHYTIIPLYLDKNKKAHYIRIPEDYEGQWIGSIFWKLTHLNIVGKSGAANELLQAQPYQWHPLIEVGANLGDYYLRGQNPVDSYRGTYIIPEKAYRSGGKETSKYLAKYAWKNIGLSTFYNPSYDDIKRQQTTTELLLKTFPFNTLGTFYKISDSGFMEQMMNKLNQVRAQKAKQSIMLDKKLMALSPAKKMAAYSQVKGWDKTKIMKILLREKNTAYSKAIAAARSNQEMAIILKMIIENNKKEKSWQQ